MNQSLMVEQPTAVVERNPAAVAWQEVVETWLDATAGSPATRIAYRRAVTGLFEWLAVDTVWEVGAQLLARYRAALMGRMDDDEPLAPATVALKLTAARSFFRFASLVGATRLRPDVINMALATFQYQTVRPYDVLSEDEQQRLVLWAYANRQPRDALMIEVMLEAGLRVSEVVGLQRQDLTRDEEGDLLLRVRRGKGRKNRLVPVAGPLAERLEMACENGCRWLFSGRRGDAALTTRRVQQIVAACRAGAGLDCRFSPHSLRHTFAIRLLRRKVGLPVIQKLLGHASLKTTQKYLDHIVLGELKEAIGV